MLKVLVVAYVLVALASAALLVPKLRKRLPFLWLRRLALIWGLVVVGYTVLSPACVYLPSVPAAPVTRRILLGVDEGQLYWLEGTTDRFAFAAGPRYWLTTIHGLCCEGGLEFIPPLRLAQMDQRELRWELVRSDGRRVPYPLDADRFLGHSHIVASGGLVFNTAMVSRIDRFDPAAGTRNSFGQKREDDGVLRSLVKTDTGLVAAFERGQSLIERSRSKRREFFVKWFDLAGKVIRERRYLFDDWSYAGAREGFYLGFADGRVFVAQVALREYQRALGKVFLLPDSGDAAELCSFTYDAYQPLSFAVSPDGRYFSTGQAVWTMEGSHVMPLVPVLRTVTWQGSSLVGIRSFPLVGTTLLGRQVNVNAMLAWVRRTDPETIASRAGSPDSAFGSPWDNLSFAVRRRPAWHGGIDDSGGADEIVRVEIR